MSEEKLYVPKCYAREKDGRYGKFLSLSFSADALIEFAKQHKTERGYLNLTISPRKQASEEGVTHSVYLDTYKPKNERREFQKAREAVEGASQGKFDDVQMPPDEGDPVPF